MRTALLAMALLLLSQVIPGNLEPFRGTELESGSGQVFRARVGGWMSGAVGRVSDLGIRTCESGHSSVFIFSHF